LQETTLQEWESSQVERANASAKTPVVFVHGLWLLQSSWDRWATLFEEAGYAVVKAGWPDDPESVEEAKAHPEVFAGKTVSSAAGTRSAQPTALRGAHPYSAATAPSLPPSRLSAARAAHTRRPCSSCRSPALPGTSEACLSGPFA
jgi:hypothetical protein